MAAIHTLTDARISDAINAFTRDPVAKDKLIGDGGGLFVRLRKNLAGGVSAVWTFIYRPVGAATKQKLVLGNYCDHATGAARAWASEQRRLLDAHVNPQTVRNNIRLAASETRDKTLGALVVAYVEHLRSTGKASADDAENLFKNHLGDAMRRRPAVDIDYREFVALINGMTDRKSRAIPRTQAKVRAYLRAAYCLSNRADQQPGLSENLKGFGITALNNPLLNVLADPRGIAKRGQRALTAEEFRLYITHVEKLENEQVRNLLLLQVFSGGQRLAQLIAGRVVGEQLHIMDRKGKRLEPRLHCVPLIGRAVDLAKHHAPIANLKENKALQLLCSGAVRRISKRMGMVENPDNPAAPGTPFNLSDVRRTIETLLAGAGVSKDIRGQLQSHGLSGVQDAHYDRHSYLPEKLAAIETLQRIIANKPAVTLRVAA